MVLRLAHIKSFIDERLCETLIGMTFDKIIIPFFAGHLQVDMDIVRIVEEEVK